MHFHFRRTVGAVKGHIGRAYGHAVRFGMGIDKGIGFARRAYGIISPALRDLGVNTANADRNVRALGNSYDSLRSQVSKVHEAGKKIGQL